MTYDFKLLRQQQDLEVQERVLTVFVEVRRAVLAQQRLKARQRQHGDCRCDFFDGSDHIKLQYQHVNMTFSFRLKLSDEFFV